MNRKVGFGLVALALVAGFILLVLSLWHPFFGMPGRFLRTVLRNYDSAGERIYWTGTNEQGQRIPFEMMSGSMMMGGWMGGGMACVDCHGADGRGGRVRMMMTVIDAPDIRWETLTEEEHGHAAEEGEHEAEEMEHPPYTEEALKRAIIHGIDPSGEPLAWPMPRWYLSDVEADDLIDYLKMLD